MVKLLAGKACKGDVVLLKSLQGEPEAGQVWAFFEAPGFLGCLVNMFKLKQYNPSTGSAVWEDTSQRALVQLEDVVASMIFCQLAGGIRTLLPWHWDKQKKHLKKEKHMSFCRLLQYSLKRLFVIAHQP